MDDMDLIAIWKEQDKKIEKSLTINTYLLRESINLKVQKSLGPLKRLKTAGIVAFVIYLIILGYLLAFAINNFTSDSLYFIISVGMIGLINLKGLSDYVRNLYRVNSINYDGTILQVQQQLTDLQLSIIRHARIMCLQLPFFTTFYLNASWFPAQIGWPYVFFQVALTSLFTYASFWLFKNHKVENLNKKWFQNLIAGSGGKSVAKALSIYKQIEDLP